MGQGVRSLVPSPGTEVEASYQETGVETIELCGRHQDQSASFRSSIQPASSCGLRLGVVTPSLSEDQTTTALPSLAIRRDREETPGEPDSTLQQTGSNPHGPYDNFSFSSGFKRSFGSLKGFNRSCRTIPVA
jgi:hypothetical protein